MKQRACQVQTKQAKQDKFHQFVTFCGQLDTAEPCDCTADGHRDQHHIKRDMNLLGEQFERWRIAFGWGWHTACPVPSTHLTLPTIHPV